MPQMAAAACLGQSGSRASAVQGGRLPDFGLDSRAPPLVDRQFLAGAGLFELGDGFVELEALGL
jgi:hypothetical protein